LRSQGKSRRHTGLPLGCGGTRRMLPLDDPRWATFNGGYKVPYDASAALDRLFVDGPSEELWEELWNELHHQGDVGQASYAAISHLVEFVRRSPRLDWNPLGLVACIELERPHNPPIHTELADDYFAAIRALPAVLGGHLDQEWSEQVVRAAVACIALARGQRWLAKAYFELDRDTAGRWFSEEFGWDLPDT
jgi:hypothetical protein